MKIWFWIWSLCFGLACYLEGAVEVGQYDDPRDLTLKIHDPFSQENVDLMQPVVGQYDIKILPPNINEDASKQYECEGLFFKQVGKLIYIDIRKPPQQQKAGAYDLAVTLKIPGEPDSANRLRRHIIYTDAATDVLLVIDNSRSMKKNDPDGLRYEACENFINLASLSRRIQRIGIIKFSGSAKVELPWSDPNAAKNRNVNRMLANSKPGNFTNINEAFELSAKMFEDSTATEKVVVLLTDGKNEPDIYRDTHKLLREQGVRIFSVGLSDQTDSSQLQTISQETGGEFFKAVDDARLLRIYNKIAQQLSEFKSIQEGEAKKELRFPISSSDEFVDINIYSFDKTQHVQVFDESGAEVPYIFIMGKEKEATRLLRISNPKPGMYRLRLENGSGEFSYDINTNSKLFMKLFPLEKKYLQGEVAHIAVSLAQRSEPMLNANIKAKILSEAGELVSELVLYDDGVHGDNHANDGVYCAIAPLDMKQGRYQVELRAEGRTPKGDSFVRYLQDYFYLLESSKIQKDYFLASILPLYLDLGNVEQRGTGKGSVRLSFEGRQAREVNFLAGDNIHQKNGTGVIPWSAIEFPEKKKLNPSQAEIFTLRCNIPKDQKVGSYSGTILVKLGDQELWLPFDIKVQESSLAREAPLALDTQVKMPRSLGEPQKMMDLDLPTPKMAENFRPNGDSSRADIHMGNMATNKLNIPKEPELNTKVSPVSASLTPQKDILFEVSPSELKPFIMEEGAYASVIFEIKNLSSWEGNVKVALDGVGELEKPLVQLEAGANVNWSWGWQGRELNNAPQQIKLIFSNPSKSIERHLNWSLPQPKWPYFLIVTIILLSVIAVVYGLLYLWKGRTSDGFVSTSAMLHLVLVLWACKVFWPPLEKLTEPEIKEMSFEMLPEDMVKPEEMVAEMPAKEEQVVLRPVEKTENTEARDVKVLRPSLSVSRELVRSLVSPAEERIVEIQKLNSTVPEIVRSLSSASLAEDAVPTVMSVNDRPTHRAKLEKRKTAEIQAEKLNVSKSEEEIVRQRMSEPLVPQATPQKVALQELDLSPITPEAQKDRVPVTMEDVKMRKVETPMQIQEKVALRELQKENVKDVEAKKISSYHEGKLVVEKESIEVPTEQMASGNIQWPKSEKMTSLAPMKSRGEISSSASKIQVKPQEITLRENLAVLQTKQKQAQAIKGQTLTMEYQDSELIRGKESVAMDVVSPLRERKVEAPRVVSENAAGTEPMLRAETVASENGQPQLVKNIESKLALPTESMSEVKLQARRSESLPLATMGSNIKLEKTQSLDLQQEKKMEAGSLSSPVSTIDLERRDLLGEQQQEVLIRDQVEEKRVRSLPLNGLGIERNSPNVMNTEKIKK